MIPKIIHYCWFGGKRKPKLVRDCIKSWKLNLEGYKIIEWNELNSDLDQPFVEEAYKLEKWAFVADYIRLKVLYEYGGIYLDTDMLVLKDFDCFLTEKCFVGAQCDKIINGAIVGAEKGNQYIKDCLLKYRKLEFNLNHLSDILIPTIMTNVFNSEFETPQIFDKILKTKDLKVYPNDFFYPIKYTDKNKVINYGKYIKDNSYTVHLWAGSWVEYNEFELIKTRKYWQGLKKVFCKLKIGNVNRKYIKKVLIAIKYSMLNNE